MLVVLAVGFQDNSRARQLPGVVFVEIRAQGVFGICDSLRAIHVLWLRGLGVVRAVSWGHGSHNRLGGWNRRHDLVPWWWHGSLPRDKCLIEFLRNGLEDLCGPYLATHGG